MKDLKVVFMGTPDFSVNVLHHLIAQTNVIGVVTKPDKLVGRKQVLTQSPVKKVALENGIQVIQPIKIREEYQNILDLNPDVIITCAYGQFLPKEILDYPKYGCINVHASLLPKLRGGAPIHKAIIYGYPTTGITIMYMGQKMDNGDIISQKSIAIEETDNVGTLHDKLSILGADLLMETLPAIISGQSNQIVQNEEEVTFAYNISREEEHIDFNKTKIEVFNQIRGLNPWPVANTILDEEEIKIYEAVIGEDLYAEQANGEIVKLYKDGIGVKVSDGEIILKTIKPAGKKKMSAKDYVNGWKEKNNLIGKVFR
ncbi:methionyl-tRNA formyltransferase [Anaerosporobacter faecicola]|uniref:methionyl-tRNA formyltransferase n=1 Tax=Anaerosporobacter faecicola TaxID=2718714 RepID=UPI001439DC5E|nr:methionyl-tRNA formyltransferase [Anaerosporobacter faecicola]